MAQIANKIGKRLLDIGIKYCFHQHTGTTVETEEEIYICSWIKLIQTWYPLARRRAQIAGLLRVEAIQWWPGAISSQWSSTCTSRISWVVEVKKDDDGQEIDFTGYVCYLPLGEGVVDIYIRHTWDSGRDWLRRLCHGGTRWHTKSALYFERSRGHQQEIPAKSGADISKIDEVTALLSVKGVTGLWSLRNQLDKAKFV